MQKINLLKYLIKLNNYWFLFLNLYYNKINYKILNKLLWIIYYEIITMKCLLWNVATMKSLLWNVLLWNDYYEMFYYEMFYDEMITMKFFTMKRLLWKIATMKWILWNVLLWNERLPRNIFPNIRFYRIIGIIPEYS